MCTCIFIVFKRFSHKTNIDLVYTVNLQSDLPLQMLGNARRGERAYHLNFQCSLPLASITNMKRVRIVKIKLTCNKNISYIYTYVHMYMNIPNLAKSKSHSTTKAAPTFSTL